MTPNQLLALWDHAVLEWRNMGTYRGYKLSEKLEKHGLESPRMVASGF